MALTSIVLARIVGRYNVIRIISSRNGVEVRKEPLRTCPFLLSNPCEYDHCL
jgi:hypothetical protein